MPVLADLERESRAHRWLWVAAVAVAVLLAFRQNASLPATFGSTWTQVLMIVCGGLWVVSRLYGDPDPNRGDAAWPVALTYVSVSALAWTVAAARGAPLGSDRLTMDLALLNDVVLLLFYGFLLCNLVSLRGVLLLAQVIVGATALSSFYGLVEQFTGLDLAAHVRPPLTRGGGSLMAGDLMREGMVRAQGAAGHPLELATIVATVLPLAVALTFGAQARGKRSWPWAACTGVLLLGIVTSLSRSSLLGAALSLAVMAMFWDRSRLKHVGKLLLVALALVGVVRPGVFLSFVNVFAKAGTDDSLYSREFGRGYAMDMWMDHPWLGIGHAGYAVPFNPVLDNQYLARLVEDGALGLATMVALWLTALIVTLRAATRLPVHVSGDALALREIAVGLSGVMVVVLFSNSVLDTLGFRQVSTLTWVLMALCWAVCRLSRRCISPRRSVCEIR